MDRRTNILIAKETLADIKRGYYLKNDEKITFNSYFLSESGYTQAEVLTTERLMQIDNDEDEVFENAVYGTQDCSFYVLDADVLETASSFDNCLVMNFANAICPGGGFLHGAQAQEESICRRSTLYASITSKEAEVMYKYNKERNEPCYSDYMILSKNVLVYKDAEGKYLMNPFKASVMTIPAPNVMKEARCVDKEELREVIKRRLGLFLKACAYYGYRDLVLGAWGCGAFGNEPEMVAECFYELFFKERYAEFFENVVFAILGKDENYNAFEKLFSDKEFYMKQNEISMNGFVEAKFNRPICNYSLCNVTDENLGYSAGITRDGIPFDAEVWVRDGQRSISVYMPEWGCIERSEKTQGKKVYGFEKHTDTENNSILGIGMVYREVYGVNDKEYVEYLEKVGIVKFEEAFYNGGVEHLTDVAGNDVVCVHISLDGIPNGKVTTNLNLKKFINSVNRRNVLSRIK